MMSERTCVWVKGSVIKKALEGNKAPTGTWPSKRTFGKKTSEHTSGEWSWVLAEVLDGDISLNSTYNASLKVKVMDEGSEFNGNEVEISPDSLNGSNGHSMMIMANDYVTNEGKLPPDDLTSLAHLHEPSVVNCLRQRYKSDIIYTSTGPILLVVNPYKVLPGLYDENTMDIYWARGEGVLVQHANKQKVGPHIYGNADAAFRQMMLGLDMQDAGMPSAIVNQSLLVSGESGAGKTVTTRHIMKYLATLSQRRAKYAQELKIVDKAETKTAGTNIRDLFHVQHWKVGGVIEEKILESNPILESFGNARTIRNDNSSRFGKYIELQFKRNGVLIGASIDTYLLETVRLIRQGPDERNYHIFYELLAAASRKERRLYHLGNYTARDFKMTNSSGTYDRRDGVDDKNLFRRLVYAMGTMGFDRKTQCDIFGVVAAFLHASNLTMLAVTDDSSKVDDTNPHLVPFLELLGLNKDNFESVLCEFAIEARSVSHIKQVSKEIAEKGLEALITSTYSALFTFLVQSISQNIQCKDENGDAGCASHGKAGCIGVLDIFGFESFPENSFEQLCINYCNEALQQQFNLFIFRSEQEEYQKAGIEWKLIDFKDNKDVIDLLDKKGSGIISILTDQCRSNVGTDKMFADQMYRLCDSRPRFEASGLTKARGQFIVHHFAGPVKYDTEGFVEKNMNEIPRGVSDLLMHSTMTFVQSLGRIVEGITSSKAGSKRPTVGSTFATQLSELRARIDETSPHYVRCIKPNQALHPNDFNNSVVADQLRCTGVLEAVRVSRAGFPHRYEHEQFVARCRFLVKDKVAAVFGGKQIDMLVNAMANMIWTAQNPNKAPPPDLFNAVGIHKGPSKVFLRQSAFEYIERFRAQQLAGGVIITRAPMGGLVILMVFVLLLSSSVWFFYGVYSRSHSTDLLVQHEVPGRKQQLLHLPFTQVRLSRQKQARRSLNRVPLHSFLARHK